jgi:hypothetical protein
MCLLQSVLLKLHYLIRFIQSSLPNSWCTDLQWSATIFQVVCLHLQGQHDFISEDGGSEFLCFYSIFCLLYLTTIWIVPTIYWSRVGTNSISYLPGSVEFIKILTNFHLIFEWAVKENPCISGPWSKKKVLEPPDFMYAVHYIQFH